MMAELPNIQALGGHTYLICVQDGEERFEIRMRVSPSGLERIGMAGGDEPQIVQDTVAYLLDRQRVDELPEALDVEDVAAAYDDYVDDIHRRAARGGPGQVAAR